MATKEHKPKKVEWDYCECGCHGLEFRAPGIYFWLWVPVRDPIPKYVLRTGHGWMGSEVGRFDDMNGVNEFVLGKIKDALKGLEKYV
jgi:hypothetical protein